MARRQLSVDEARELAEREQSGEFDNDPRTKQIARNAIAQAAIRSQGTVSGAELTEGEQRAAQNVAAGRGIIPAADIARRTGGAAQVATSVLSSAVAEPLGGIAGVAAGIYGIFQGQGFNDPANAVQRAVSDALTFQPRTSTGQEMLMGLAAPLKKFDDSVDYIATQLSFGNELARTMIYTNIMGATNIAGLKVGGVVRSSNSLLKSQARIERIADELGIDLDPADFASSIIEAAKDMTPTTRNANAAQLRDALVEAGNLQKASASNKAQLALESKSFVDTKEANRFAKVATRELMEEGFDLPKMRHVTQALDDLAALDTRSPSQLTAPKTKGKTVVNNEKVKVQVKTPTSTRATARIQDIQTISNRLDKVIDSRATPKVRRQPKTVREDLAITKLQEKLNNWLDQQFNSDMISGDPRGIRRWNEAREARQAYNDRFLEDNTIVQLMDRNATPGEITSWLRGASAAGAKPAATRTVKRIREILGDNHPSVEGMRQDFLYDIAAPLFNDGKPDWNGFIRNYDRTMAKQSHLVEAMGLEKSKMSQLREFAAQAQNKATKPLFNLDVAKAISVFTFGHSLAKKSLLVRTATVPIRILGRIIFGKNFSQRKMLMAELAGANHSAPFMDRFTGPAAVAITGSAMADIEKASEKAGKDVENVSESVRRQINAALGN